MQEIEIGVILKIFLPALKGDYIGRVLDISSKGLPIIEVISLLDLQELIKKKEKTHGTIRKPDEAIPQ